MMPFNPWAELRDRQHIVFSLVALPAATGGAVYWPKDDRAAILIDPALTRRERRAALAHELVHDERGGGAECVGMPATWDAVVTRAEAAVDNEVARRLVPADELHRFCACQVEIAGHVGALEVAEHFDVPEGVAGRALRQMSNNEQ